MRVRLLTDGGYGLWHDEVGKIYEARKHNYGYLVKVRGDEELYFYSDEIEIIQDHIYFLEAAEDKAALTSLVVITIAVILCVIATISVIF
jgi:hypothetical protein